MPNLSINNLTSDNLITAAEISTPITLTGTAEDLQKVTFS